MAPLLRGRCFLFSLCQDPASAARWRSLGTVPLLGDLDHPASLKRLSGLAHGVFHFAPPPGDTLGDPRTRHLIATLERGQSLPQRVIYISTTGVYGDCRGDKIDETRPTRPTTARALRRVDAERQLRAFGSRTGCAVTILRAPGIYAEDRLPLERLRERLPVPDAPFDPWTNHIHAQDLALAAIRAMRRGRPNRVYNAVDDSHLTLGGYYEQLARHFGLPLPQRQPIETLKQQISELRWSFMAESRQISNNRIKSELGLEWQFPTISHALSSS